MEGGPHQRQNIGPAEEVLDPKISLGEDAALEIETEFVR